MMLCSEFVTVAGVFPNATCTQEVQMPGLLEVQDLTVEYGARPNCLHALNGITLEVQTGEVVGVLGESGSGKTTLGLAVLRLLPPHGRIVRGSMRFRGRDLYALGEKELQAFRGSEVSMIFQEPALALNPFMRALDQVEEVIRAHRDWKRERRRDEARRVLHDVGMDKTQRLLSAWPNQLSGGERQRLVLAQAIACKPALVIADEPSASLDALLQCEWMALMRDLRERLGLALLLITHDPAILSGLADRVVVMYRGQIVEEGSFEQIIRKPLHPYTRALLRSIPPPPGTGTRQKRLPVIPSDPAARVPANGACAFEPRCPDRFHPCAHGQPPAAIPEHDRRVRCFKYDG
jgi:oligopeptide/dipeptide ABC transporter ATP-binding protein